MNISLAVERLIEVCRRQHKSLSTERTYAGWLRRYCEHVRHIDPEFTSEKKAESFLTWLAKAKDVSASTQSQAFNTILFFYKDVLGKPLKDVDALRATRLDRIRYAPTDAEVRQLIPNVRNVGGYPVNLIVRLLYGCGLRVSEPLSLRIKDVDIANGKLFILGAKGGKDRFVSIPCSLHTELSAQLDFANSVGERDRLNRLPVALPGLLAKKYPHWQFSLKWAWLFPARTSCIHPRTGISVRWRCHEANIQRCVRAAARPLGLDITPHHLRHGYATHCLNAGQNPRSIQQAMGHSQLDTTMGYFHSEALSVKSPLDT